MAFLDGNSIIDRYNLRPKAMGKPFTSQTEIMDELRRRFNKQPLSYRTDPLTGKVIATKSLQKSPFPSELQGQPQASRLRSLFTSGDQQTNQLDPGGAPQRWATPTNILASLQREPLKPNSHFSMPSQESLYRSPKPLASPESNQLSSTWILPKGALSGTTFNQTTTPTTDAQRQWGYNEGISNMGQNYAKINPESYWPSSTFNIPTVGGSQEPVFGGVQDYTTGQYRFPFEPYLSQTSPYGEFNTSQRGLPNFASLPQKFVQRRGLIKKKRTEETVKQPKKRFGMGMLSSGISRGRNFRMG